MTLSDFFYCIERYFIFLSFEELVADNFKQFFCAPLYAHVAKSQTLDDRVKVRSNFTTSNKRA